MGVVIENINGGEIVTGIIKEVNGKRVTVPYKPYDFETKEYVDIA